MLGFIGFIVGREPEYRDPINTVAGADGREGTISLLTFNKLRESKVWDQLGLSSRLIKRT